MDGPNVNLKLLEKINEEQTLNEFHHLISIGSCGLHTIHGAFCAGVEATEWSIKKILTGAYYVLHYSPARREDVQLGWLVSSRVSLTSWGEAASLALVGNTSSDRITIKIHYGVDVLLRRPALHPIFSYWVD